MDRRVIKVVREDRTRTDTGVKPSDESLVIDLSNVTKTFGTDGDAFTAVADVDLQVKRAEFVALVGPSGCGKSTLLRIIAGLVEPTCGSVTVLGNKVTGPRKDVGLMLQQATLFPWRSLLANVLLPIELDRKPSAEDRQRAMGILERVGLSDFSDNYPRELSGGMQQRGALSRLLITSPRIMLLDEPFGALDEFTREKLNLELASVATSSAAILVTHSIAEAVFMSDRVIAMGTGPGHVAADIPVGLERPRSLGVQTTLEFQKLCSSVRESLGMT